MRQVPKVPQITLRGIVSTYRKFPVDNATDTPRSSRRDGVLQSKSFRLLFRISFVSGHKFHSLMATIIKYILQFPIQSGQTANSELYNGVVR